jgi:hypothetical protein
MSSTLVLNDHRDPSYITTRKIHLRDRLAARMRLHALDQALAQGTNPDSGVALALRAQTLIGRPARRQLADQAREIVLTAHRPSSGWRPAAPISRRLILRVEPELSQLARRLLAEEPVDVRGVAGVEALLRNGCGPLYAPDESGANELRAAINDAIDSLEPQY